MTRIVIRGWRSHFRISAAAPEPSDRERGIDDGNTSPLSRPLLRAYGGVAARNSSSGRHPGNRPGRLGLPAGGFLGRLGRLEFLGAVLRPLRSLFQRSLLQLRQKSEGRVSNALHVLSCAVRHAQQHSERLRPDVGAT